MTIVIPMAGLSSRFARTGYTLPKYMLYANGKSLFNLAVSSFNAYFKSCRFVFIARDVFDTRRFIDEECRLMGIVQYDIVMLGQPTRGQAETVIKGIEGARIESDESILIFNIDTFRPGFTFPESLELWDGYLECFIGTGDNWSYARTADGSEQARVVETAEKRAISQYCSTGIYYFRRVADFMVAYHQGECMTNDFPKELYVAPLYNALIDIGREIHVHVICRNEVIFCGTPDEYTEYLRMVSNI